MATTNYNSFPQAPEVLLEKKGEASAADAALHLIRRKQSLDQILENEIPLSLSEADF